MVKDGLLWLLSCCVVRGFLCISFHAYAIIDAYPSVQFGKVYIVSFGLWVSGGGDIIWRRGDSLLWPTAADGRISGIIICWWTTGCIPIWYHIFHRYGPILIIWWIDVLKLNTAPSNAPSFIHSKIASMRLLPFERAFKTDILTWYTNSNIQTLQPARSK